MKSSTLQYRSLLREDLEDVRSLMLSACRSIPDGIQQSVQALIQGGGKRLRPALVLLSAATWSADHDSALVTAAAVEMLHTATLIHDDLIDRSLVRRGLQTLNAHWPSTATVLAGDIVFALAAKLIAGSANTALVMRFAETLETICQGELEQMFGNNGGLPPIDAYYERIYAKTASLFALSVEAGPLLAGTSQEAVLMGRRLGRLIGEAFQITDDVLDLMGTESELGKPAGADLRQGLATLPLLLYAHATPADPRPLAVLAHKADDTTLRELAGDLRASDAITEAMQIAERHVADAISLIRTLPDSPHRRALEDLARYAVNRRH
ncbi:MAG: polyprenyl synthetase family protein [Anaerolineae bacterium]